LDQCSGLELLRLAQPLPSQEGAVGSHQLYVGRFSQPGHTLFHSDNFAYVGKRTTGGQAGAYAILPPDWKGTLPGGIDGSFESPTPFVLIYGRTLVSGPDDFPAVNALQDQYKMIPLALWRQDDPQVPEGRDVFQPYDPSNDPLADWRTINRAWAENPVDRIRGWSSSSPRSGWVPVSRPRASTCCQCR
jgi:hypothetical protein